MGAVLFARVIGDDINTRLDLWFQQYYPALTHRMLEVLLQSGQIQVDKQRARIDQKLITGQVVRIPPCVLNLETRNGDSGPSYFQNCINVANFRVCVLYQDASILAVNKPAGLSVQGGTSTTYHIDDMLDMLQFGASERPRLVHRLDKNTSGVLLLARTAVSASALAKVFQIRAVRKVYWAVVAGIPVEISGRISAPIVKVPLLHGEKVVVDTQTGLLATTTYHVVRKAHDDSSAWVELRPRTGRTHQVRVHCAFIGTPVLGDNKYSVHIGKMPILHLHACLLTIPNPTIGNILCITAPLPRQMVRTFTFLGFFRDNS